MEAIFGIVGASLVGSILYVIAWATRHELVRVLMACASEAGVTDLRTKTLLGVDSGVEGRLGSLHVTLEPCQTGQTQGGTRIVLGGLGHGPFGLTIRPESPGKAFERAFDGGEIELGDPAFDEVAYVQGEPALARAVLGARAREGLRELLRGRIRVPGPTGEETLDVSAILSGDALTVEVGREAKADAAWLTAALGSLASLASELVRPGDVAARLASRVSSEAPAGIRLGHVRTLAREFPDHPETREGLRAASRDADARVRLEAGKSLGEEGLATLLGVATGEDVREEDAEGAVVALGGRMPADEGARLLVSSLAADRPRLALACVEALGRAGEIEAGSAAADALERALESPQGEVAAAAARSLSATGLVSAQPSLVAALARDDAAVRVAAAEALGRSGTTRAVVPLRECADSHPLDRALGRAARQAIAQIQARVPGASPGQLSLASGEAGQLSLAAEVEEGRLTLDVDGERDS